MLKSLKYNCGDIQKRFHALESKINTQNALSNNYWHGVGIVGKMLAALRTQRQRHPAAY